MKEEHTDILLSLIKDKGKCHRLFCGGCPIRDKCPCLNPPSHNTDPFSHTILNLAKDALIFNS